MDKKRARSALILWLLVALLFEATEAVALGKACTDDSDCPDTVANSGCVDDGGAKSCSCSAGHTQQGEVCKTNKEIGDDCSTTDDVCTTVGTACVDDGAGTTKCLCNGDYVTNAADSACLKNRIIGDDCSTTDDVCTTVGTVCVDDGAGTTMCLCNVDYVANAAENTCLKKIGVSCGASECIFNAECSQTCRCLTDFTSNADKTKCLKNKGIGEVCSTTDDECTTVGTACVDESESASTTKCLCDGDYVANDNNDGCLIGKGFGEVCSTTDNKCTPAGTVCVGDGTGTTTKCLCDEDYVANAKTDGCLKNMGTSCGSTTVCAEDGVCDTNSDSPTCVIGSGGTCDAVDSKCVSHSECTESKCTCSNGDADEATKLCPAPSGGFRETFSMLVVTVCLWLSLF